MQATKTMDVTAEERRAQIALMVVQKGKVYISDLVKIFNVTEASIRRDLILLEQENRLKRVYGGAISTPISFRTDSFSEKEQSHIIEKKRIGDAAVEMINPGDIILFASGTTTLQIVRSIPHPLQVSNLITMVTNSLPIANEILKWTSPNLTLLGGLLLPDYQATIGPQTIELLNNITADVAFIGADGLTLEGGATTANVLMAEVDRVMVERARKAILVTDSSKIGRAGFIPFTPISSFSAIITDTNAPLEFVEAVRNFGVDIILV